MRIKRFVALAVIALLVVGAMGAIAARALAQPSYPTAQGQATAAPDDEEAVGADTDDVEEQVGDQNEADAETGDNEQDAVPAGTPAITAEQAQAAAEAYLNAGTATQVELDDEDGQLVYSVEFGGTEVKVDAMTGAVLGVETDQD
jgi:uncharacterized membrane protein YkoI